ncbi:MAG TPA: MFS transporter [Gaiellaceae bacterium]|nr:MFS transporter [Gaiellaceae bacterium]
MDHERQHHNVTLAILTLAGAAFSLQQTMVFPALRTFQEEFGSSTAWTTWVLTGFLVSGAVLTPILGRLGDQFGKERLLLISLGLFLAGCLGAAFAWNLWSLIAFRIVSGAGGALFPLSFAIIRDEFPADKVKVGIGLLSAVWGVGGGFGIVLSGLIVDNFSWRLLFLLGSIPVALSLVLVARYVPESPIRSPSRVDVPGALLLSSGLISLMLALTEGEHWGWGSPLLLGVLALAAGSFVLWGVVESRSSSPMVDLRMLAHRPILLTNIATLISGFALFSCFVLVPAFVETDASNGYGFSASATKAGLYLLPSSLAMLVAGPLAGALGRRYGSKWPLAIGMLVVSVAALLFAAMHDEPGPVLLASALLGLGVGAAFAAMAGLIADNVDPREMGVAGGMNTVVRMIGGVVGGQVGAALLTARTIGDSSVPAESAFTITFALSAVTALVAAAIAVSIGSRPLRRLEAAVPQAPASSARTSPVRPQG